MTRPELQRAYVRVTITSPAIDERTATPFRWTNIIDRSEAPAHHAYWRAQGMTTEESAY